MGCGSGVMEDMRDMRCGWSGRWGHAELEKEEVHEVEGEVGTCGGSKLVPLLSTHNSHYSQYSSGDRDN